MNEKYHYEFRDNENALYVWTKESYDNSGEPFLFQPIHPDGFSWESKEQALGWAEEFLYRLENPVEPEILPIEENLES